MGVIFVLMFTLLVGVLVNICAVNLVFKAFENCSTGGRWSSRSAAVFVP